MQTVSLETAKGLSAAGLKHDPQLYDVYHITGEISVLEARIAMTGAEIGNAPGWRLTEWSHITDENVRQWPWLPRLDQVMDEIRRLVPDAEITFVFGEEVGCYVESTLGIHIYQFEANAHSSTAVEAAGLVLAEIMEAQDVTDS